MDRHIGPSADEYVAEIHRLRRETDRFFANSSDSPIPDEIRSADFNGLRYYPPDLAFRVEADLVAFDFPQVVQLGSTQGDVRPMVRYAELQFAVMGQQCRLVAFKDVEQPDSGELFVPFKDATSGGETYGAGRYVEVMDESDEPSPRKVVIDFNLAYSPWCAYNITYSCTLPPPENVLPVSIMAGEMQFPIDH